MRRSICLCEPASCLAGEIRTFQFIYIPSFNLPKGSKIRFNFLTQGRPIDWELPQINPKEKKNLIWAQLPDGQEIKAKIVDKNEHFPKLYEFTLPNIVVAGEKFIILVGSLSNEEKEGNRAQLNIQRRRPFQLQIDLKGKGDFKEQEMFHLDVRGNVLKNIRIIAPSIVIKNRRFDVLVRFEDEYENLTNYAPEGSLIELSYENQRENLNWKLFIPETGFINLPNLYFNEVDVYRIQLCNLKTGDKYLSSPIKCLSESPTIICWGLFHGESEKNDSLENIDACLRQFRDEKALQFYAVSPFESVEETSIEEWKHISQVTSELNEEQRFCIFLGFQYSSEKGLRQILYLKPLKNILRQKDPKSNTLEKVYNSLNGKEALSIPCFTMGKGMETTFTGFDSDLERVVEIYNAWGSSEQSAKGGNPRPIRSSSKKGIQETETGSIISALKKNCRFGFVAGGLDDRGAYEGFYQEGQEQYSPGLTAVLATEQTKEAIFQAMIARSCYATTGERIIVGFQLAGTSMGGELNTKLKPGLIFNRHLVGYVAGTSSLKEVIIIRNGVPIKIFHPKDYFIDFTYDDEEHLSRVALPSSDNQPSFTFYYLRVIQENGHMAWSSPIWVDYIDFSESKKIR